jgi:DnaK suppressor protein
MAAKRKKPKSKPDRKSSGRKASAKKPARKAAKKPAAKSRKPIKTKATAARKPVAAPVRGKPVLKPVLKTVSAAPRVDTRPKAAVLPIGRKPGRAGDGPTPFAPYTERRGEDYMNAAQSKHFREILLNWKRSLMEEVDRTVHHMQDEAANFPDPNDRATQEEEFALELRTRDRERKLIKKIDEALLSLDTGDYGYCEICGVEIGVKRLEARPTATLCIDCKTLDEIKERQLG